MRSGREAVTPRVLLAKRPGGSVTRIRERCLAGRDECLVQPLEVGDREVHLAPDLQDLRYVLALEPVRHTFDGADVGRDVLAGTPIPSRRAAHQSAGAVDQINGQPVDFQLAQVRGDFTHLAFDSVGPRRELLDGERVVERQHAVEMLHGGEQRGVGAGDPLSG